MGAKVFADYDQEALDKQLNLRARWPEHPEVFARWAEDSRKTRDAAERYSELSFGTEPSETLELFLPETGAKPPPCLIFIHGGYWQALDKSDFSYLAPAFLEAGIAYVSVNYGLAPDFSIVSMVEQTRRAIAWLYRNGAAQGIDRDRLFVAGHSAGGHLAAMALITDWTSLGSDLPADLLKGGVSVSGLYEMEPIHLSYHNEILGVRPEEVPGLSPRNLIPATSAPLICAVGSEETDEFLRQQDAFLADWREAGLPGDGLVLPGLTHFSAVDALGQPEHPLFQRVSRLIEEAA